MSVKGFNTQEKMNFHLEIVNFTLFSMMYYSAMLFITIDRLVACTITFTYAARWNFRKGGNLLIGTTIFAVLYWIAIEVYHIYFPRTDIAPSVTCYFYLPFDCLFVVTAVTTYTIIFTKYSNAVRRRASTVASASSQKKYKKPNHLDVLKKSKFYVSALLILTFILLVVLVDISYVVLYRTNRGFVGQHNRGIMKICYTVSFLFDALIYIFLQSHLRKLLKELVTKFKGMSRRSPSVAPRVDGMIKLRTKTHPDLSPAAITKYKHSE